MAGGETGHGNNLLGRSALRGDRSEAAARARRAVVLSAFVMPGAGQIYLGDRWKGAVIIVGVLFGFGYFAIEIARAFSGYFGAMYDLSTATGGSVADPAKPFSSTLFRGLLFGGVPALGFWAWSVIDALQAKKRL